MKGTQNLGSDQNHSGVTFLGLDHFSGLNSWAAFWGPSTRSEVRKCFLHVRLDAQAAGRPDMSIRSWMGPGRTNSAAPSTQFKPCSKGAKRTTEMVSQTLNSFKQKLPLSRSGEPISSIPGTGPRRGESHFGRPGNRSPISEKSNLCVGMELLHSLSGCWFA